MAAGRGLEAQLSQRALDWLSPVDAAAVEPVPGPLPTFRLRLRGRLPEMGVDTATGRLALYPSIMATAREAIDRLYPGLPVVVAEGASPYAERVGAERVGPERMGAERMGTAS